MKLGHHDDDDDIIIISANLIICNSSCSRIANEDQFIQHSNDSFDETERYTNPFSTDCNNHPPKPRNRSWPQRHILLALRHTYVKSVPA